MTPHLLALLTLLATPWVSGARAQSLAEPVEPPLTDSVFLSQSAPFTDANKTYWALGAASTSGILGTNHPASITVSALSGSLFIQGYVSVASVTAGMIGLGVLLKTTVWGDNSAGLHVGGGLGLSTTGPTEFRANAGAGVHFIIPQLSRIMFLVDGGLTVSSVAGSIGFQAGALSPTLGLGICYFLGEP